MNLNILKLKKPVGAKRYYRDDFDLGFEKKQRAGLDSEDIVDAIIYHSGRTKSGSAPQKQADEFISENEHLVYQIRNVYSLKDDKKVSYQGENLVRNYNEGGLTSFDYSWVINNITTWALSSLKLFFTCLILATLAEKRSQLLEDDKKQGLTKKHKAETLVIEWSGGNDLITANPRPSQLVVERAVAARVENLKELMKNGYQHFVWFNLPNLALTPKYYAQSSDEKANAEKWIKYFNSELEKACKELSTNYPQCTFELFDVNSIFDEIYQNPEAYGFDLAKLGKSYTKESLHINQDGTSPAKGYMFWDDVHPTADVHAILADRFYKKFNAKYSFSAPKNDATAEEKN
jgi:phospholipase/lecithinase/hemolysin